jgi:F-type H+-transporting ATPase subunit epsilon
MAKKLTVDLVTPKQQVFSREVDMVVVPGSEGVFGVLEGHSPLISTLKPGLIEVTDEGKVDSYFISGGFAEVTTKGCSILAEEAIDPVLVKRSEAEERLEKEKKALEKATTKLEQAQHRKKIAISEALLEAVKH